MHRFIALDFIKLWKVCGNLALSKFTGTIFPTAFARFMSLGHTLVVLAICQTFSLPSYCHGDLWSAIFDSTILIALGSLMCTHRRQGTWIDKCCVCSDCSTSHPSPRLSPSHLRPPCSPRHNCIEIRPVNNPTMASKSSVKKKGCIYVTLQIKN